MHGVPTIIFFIERDTDHLWCIDSVNLKPCLMECPHFYLNDTSIIYHFPHHSAQLYRDVQRFIRYGTVQQIHDGRQVVYFAMVQNEQPVDKSKFKVSISNHHIMPSTIETLFNSKFEYFRVLNIQKKIYRMKCYGCDRHNRVKASQQNRTAVKLCRIVVVVYVVYAQTLIQCFFLRL